MDAKSLSRRTLLLSSTSIAAIGLLAGAARASYSVIIDNDVRLIATNVDDLTTEVGRFFPRILTETDKAMLIALETTAKAVFDTANSIWAPPDAVPAQVPVHDLVAPFVSAVYAWLGALDALSNILNAIQYTKLVAVCIEVCGLIIVMLRAVEAGFGIGRPVEAPGGLIITGARAFANQHRLEEALTGLQVPVASRMS